MSSGYVQLVHGGERGRRSDSARSDQRWPEARFGLCLHWTGEHQQQPSQLNSEKRRVLPVESQTSKKEKKRQEKKIKEDYVIELPTLCN